MGSDTYESAGWPLLGRQTTPQTCPVHPDESTNGGTVCMPQLCVLQTGEYSNHDGPI